MNQFDVIRRPIITEKGVEKKDSERTLCLEVHVDANKTHIRQAVEKLVFGELRARADIPDLSGQRVRTAQLGAPPHRSFGAARARNEREKQCERGATMPIPTGVAFGHGERKG